MAQSIITIGEDTDNLNITGLTDISNGIYTEKVVIPDPNDPSALPNSVLTQGGHSRRKLQITGHCSQPEKSILKVAHYYGTKVYPTIYGPANDTTNLTPTSYYYITKFDTSYKIGDPTVYYTMELTWGGSGPS